LVGSHRIYWMRLFPEMMASYLSWGCPVIYKQHNIKKCPHLKCRGSRHWTRRNLHATANHYGLNINLLRCALAHALLKAGFGALRPYVLVLLDIVPGFGISGRPQDLCTPWIRSHYRLRILRISSLFFFPLYLKESQKNRVIRGKPSYQNSSFSTFSVVKKSA
jgi:hypothetical protein